MSVRSPRLRRALTTIAATGLLAALVPATTASAATPKPRDITKFACPSDEVPDPGFTDIEGNTHEAAIACIVWYQLSGGTTDTTYSPERAVGRGQMATFLRNLLVAGGVTMPSNPSDAFDDDNGTQHEVAINQLAALDVVRGTGERRYEPNVSVSREQMATFLNNAFEKITGTRLTSNEDFFTDDDDRFHEKNINAVAAAGIAAGTSETTFEPERRVRRDQMASFLARETDLLVQQGRVDKPDNLPADARLDQTSVTQGGKVTGKVVTKPDVELTSARVSGCGLSNRSLTLTGSNNAFEFTVPVTQVPGTCTLTFTMTRAEGGDVVDDEQLTVVAAGSLTAAPELLSVKEKSRSGGDVVVTFTFDEALNKVSLSELDFRVYSEDAAQETAKTADHGSSSGTVDATFPASAFDAATTAAVRANAVEDGSNVANPEGAVSLQQEAVTLSSTDAPDLETVSRVDGGINDWLFTFDDPVNGDPGGAGDYHLVLDNGEVLDGDELATTGKDSERRITFDDTIESGRTVVRGYVDAGTVSDKAQDPDPLTGVEGNVNPTQAADVAGGGDSPYLIKIELRRSDDQVVYTFNRSVSLVGKNLTDTEVFRAYNKAGDEVSTNNATASGSTVVASFDEDAITDSTVGASVLADAVRASTGMRANNEVDERLPDTAGIMPGNQGGETTAPDLQTVERTVSGNNTVLVFTFDAPVSQVLDGNGGALAMYQPDGTRTVLRLNSVSGNQCSTSSNEVRCSASSSSTTGQLMETAVLGGVEHRTVGTGGTNPDVNYESSAPVI
jgi:hypothetical protein